MGESQSHSNWLTFSLGGSVGVCVHVWLCAYTCLCVWRPEEDVGCPDLPLSAFSLGQGLSLDLGEPGGYHALAFLLSLPMTWHLTVKAAPSFLCGSLLGIWTHACTANTLHISGPWTEIWNLEEIIRVKGYQEGRLRSEGPLTLRALRELQAEALGPVWTSLRAQGGLSWLPSDGILVQERKARLFVMSFNSLKTQ